MRSVVMVLVASLFSVSPAAAQSVTIGVGIQLPLPPPLVVVAPVPVVQYAPSIEANLFFYGGQYWLFQNGWYTSRGHGGPWVGVVPGIVPRPILQVPVQYYRVPPGHWKQWQKQKPPHWSNDWGQQWSEQRNWHDDGGDRHDSHGHGGKGRGRKQGKH